MGENWLFDTALVKDRKQFSIFGADKTSMPSRSSVLHNCMKIYNTHTQQLLRYYPAVSVYRIWRAKKFPFKKMYNRR